MDGFVLSVLEGRELVYFVGYFDGNRDDVSGTFLGLVVGGIMNTSEINDMPLNESSPVSCIAEMYLLLRCYPSLWICGF